MAMSATRELKRDLNIVREGVRRMIAHPGTFTLSDVGAGIDGMLMPGEIPRGVSRLVPRLVELGHVVRVRHGLYSLAAGGEVALRRLIQPKGAADLESLVRPRYLPKPFRVLGLAYPCSMEELRARWRELARKHHPDRGGDVAKFIKLKEAYDEAVTILDGRSTAFWYPATWGRPVHDDLVDQPGGSR